MILDAHLAVSEPWSLRAGYALRFLAEANGLSVRIDPGEVGASPIRLHYAPPAELATAAEPPVERGPSLTILIPALVSDPSAALVEAAAALDAAPGLPGDPPVPIFGGGEARVEARASLGGPPGRRIAFHFDLLANVFLHLSRWEETQPSRRDRFGRFPSEASVLRRHGVLLAPVLDRLAALLLRILVEENPDPRAALPRRALWPEGEASAIHLSHDVDQSVSWPRRLLRDLAATGRSLAGGDAAAAIARTVRHLRGRNRDPLLFPRRVHDYESEQHLPASWFFLTVPHDPQGRRYRVTSGPYRRFLRDLRESGSEVGLHGSMQAASEAPRMEAERRVIEGVVGTSVEGNRQHYLIYSAGRTARDLAAAGLRYDSSVGYSDVAGFRAGTSLPFRPFDAASETATDLIEIPLGVMDVALIAPGQACVSLDELWDELLERQAITGGLLTVLWHPRMFDPETHPAGRAPYESLVRRARARSLPFFTGRDIADWWRAREGVTLESYERNDRTLRLRYTSREALRRLTISIEMRASGGARAVLRDAHLVRDRRDAAGVHLTLGEVPAAHAFEIELSLPG